MTRIVEAKLDLRELGLTHAKGKSDRCGGLHTGFVEIDEPVDLDALEAALQKLHEQVHQHGTQYVLNCREPGCLDALEAIGIECYS